MKRAITSALLCGFLATPVAAQDIPLSKILVDKENWRVAAKSSHNFTYLEGGPDGGVFWVNANGGHGTLTAKGDLEPGPDILIVRTAQTALVGKRGYAIDGGAVNFFEGGKKLDTFKLKWLKAPNCLCVWPDESHLVIGEADGAYLWAVRIEKDGPLGPGDRYYSLRTKPGVKMHVAAMTMDAGYLLYACTPLGIQVFDPTGRLSGVIAAPSKEPMTAITIGGEKADTLFIAAGDKIFARRIQGKAPYTLKKTK